MFLPRPVACLLTLAFWISPLYVDRSDCYSGFDPLPAFSYVFVVTAFNKLLHMDSHSASASALHPQSFLIWNNVNIVYRNKSLFFHNWFSNGLLLVNQLFYNEGNLFTFADFCSRSITFKRIHGSYWAIRVHMLFKCSVYIRTFCLSS